MNQIEKDRLADLLHDLTMVIPKFKCKEDWLTFNILMESFTFLLHAYNEVIPDLDKHLETHHGKKKDFLKDLSAMIGCGLNKIATKEAQCFQ